MNKYHKQNTMKPNKQQVRQQLKEDDTDYSPPFMNEENRPYVSVVYVKKVEEEDQCDFCDKQKHHLVKRDAGYDEWTCKDCYKEQYEEEEEEDECRG